MTKQQFIEDCRNAASNIRSGNKNLAHMGMLSIKSLEVDLCGEIVVDSDCINAIKDAWQAERDYIVANNATKQESSGPLEKCPKCGGTDFESPDGPLFISDERIEECIKCNSCGSLWWEYYDHSKTIYEKPLEG
jgi:hypothetical protein